MDEQDKCPELDQILDKMKAKFKETNARLFNESPYRTQAECQTCKVEFDLDLASTLGLESYEVRNRWPRWFGKCNDCGYEGIRYASFAHYVYGDW